MFFVVNMCKYSIKTSKKPYFNIFFSFLFNFFCTPKKYILNQTIDKNIIGYKYSLEKYFDLSEDEKLKKTFLRTFFDF